MMLGEQPNPAKVIAEAEHVEAMVVLFRDDFYAEVMTAVGHHLEKPWEK